MVRRAVVGTIEYNHAWEIFVNLVYGYRLLVDLGKELVVAEKRVLILTDLDGATAELSMY
jgi:hypothetical protein